MEWNNVLQHFHRTLPMPYCDASAAEIEARRYLPATPWPTKINMSPSEGRLSMCHRVRPRARVNFACGHPTGEGGGADFGVAIQQDPTVTYEISPPRPARRIAAPHQEGRTPVPWSECEEWRPLRIAYRAPDACRSRSWTGTAHFPPSPSILNSYSSLTATVIPSRARGTPR